MYKLWKKYFLLRQIHMHLFSDTDVSHGNSWIPAWLPGGTREARRRWETQKAGSLPQLVCLCSMLGYLYLIFVVLFQTLFIFFFSYFLSFLLFTFPNVTTYSSNSVVFTCPSYPSPLCSNTHFFVCPFYIPGAVVKHFTYFVSSMKKVLLLF